MPLTSDSGKQHMIDWAQCVDVERKADTVSGAWVVRGTRVPVEAILENAVGGVTAEEIVAEIFPSLPLEPTRRVIAFAKEAHAAPNLIR